MSTRTLPSFISALPILLFGAPLAARPAGAVAGTAGDAPLAQVAAAETQPVVQEVPDAPAATEAVVQVVPDIPPAPPAAGEPAAEEPAAAPRIDRERVSEAVVEYDTPWNSGWGLLVRDARTVIVPAPSTDAGRTISVHAVTRPGSTAEAADVEQGVVWTSDHRFYVLTLDQPLDARPLEVSDRLPALGDHVFTLDATSDTGETRFALVETTVTSVSDSRFALGMDDAQTFAGAPVLDASGQLVGILDWDFSAVSVAGILAPVNLEPRPMSVLPVLALRGFYEWGGMSDGTGGVLFEFGVALWDQLGIVLDFGVNGGQGRHLMRLDPIGAASGPGQVAVDDIGIDTGLELQYRLMIAPWTLPMYLRLAAGVRYSYVGSDAQGVAVYSDDPGCDPSTSGSSCPLISGPSPGDLNRNGVGLIVGADVTLGSFSLGYRFIPEAAAFHIPDTHMLLFGFSMF